MKGTGSMRGMRVVVYATSIFLTLICLLPVVLLLINSTRSTTDILRGLSFQPGVYFKYNIETISRADLGVNIWRAMGNSLMVATSSTFLSMYVSALTAFAVKAYDARGNRLFYGFVLAVIMIPSQLNIIGFYKYMSSLKLLNSYIPLIMPGVAAPTSVFFVKKYLDSVFQVSLLEAARIDGAGEFHAYNRIILPIMVPAVATMGLMYFITCWNSFLVPYIFISKMGMYTTPLMTLVLNINNVTPDYGARYAGLTVSLLPIIVVYMLAGKYIIRGVSLGGVKE